MYRLTGLALTAIAAGLFAAGPALAQTGSGSQTGSSQRDRSGAQSGSTSGQSGQAGASGQSERSGTMSGSETGQMAPSDQKFLQKAAQGSKAEIELGKLAQERGQRDEIKQLGQNLVQDHSKSLDEIQQIAQSKGITISAEPDSKRQKTYDRLSKLSGEEFDRAFVKEVHQDHKRDIDEFRKQSRNAKDEQVKDFATRTLPALQQHEQMAARHMGSSAAPRTDEADTPGAGSTRDRDNPGRTPGTGTSGTGTSGSSGGSYPNPR